MTPDEARTQLKQRNPNFSFRSLEVEFPPPSGLRFAGALHAEQVRKRISALTITSGEAVLVALSGPPQAPAVLGVARHERFQGEEPNADQFVKDLVAKFGPPDVADQHRTTFHWFVDQPKQSSSVWKWCSSPGSTALFEKLLRAPFDEDYQETNQGAKFSTGYFSRGQHPALGQVEAHFVKPLAQCGRVLLAQLTRTGPQQGLLMSYRMYLFDFTSAYRNMVDLNRQARGAATAREDEVIRESEQRKKPTF